MLNIEKDLFEKKWEVIEKAANELIESSSKKISFSDEKEAEDCKKLLSFYMAVQTVRNAEKCESKFPKFELLWLKDICEEFCVPFMHKNNAPVYIKLNKSHCYFISGDWEKEWEECISFFYDIVNTDEEFKGKCSIEFITKELILNCCNRVFYECWPEHKPVANKTYWEVFAEKPKKRRSFVEEYEAEKAMYN